MSPYEAFCAAVKQSGGQIKFGEMLGGVSQSTVSWWLTRKKMLPAEYVLKAEAETGVPRSALRPDIYPPDLDVSVASICATAE